MKILLCNYRYFLAAGTERYLFSIKKKFDSEGITAIPFSVNYKQNQETAYSRYFVNPVGDGTQVFFQESNFSSIQKLRLFFKYLYSLEAKRDIQNLITVEKPNLAYMLQIIDVLSPSIIDGCADMGIPVIHQIFDFHLMCPAHFLLRDGKICEECESGLYHALKYSCVKNSLPVTVGRTIAMFIHRFVNIYEKVNAFILPSKFLREKMIKAGFPPKKLHRVPYFVDVTKFAPQYDGENYVLYFGRIAKEKGLDILLKAWNLIQKQTKAKLKLAGACRGGEIARLKTLIREEQIQNVEFVGFKEGQALGELIRNCLFTVVPSVWYENTPNSIYESMAYGKPVIGSNIGSIPEQIEHGVDGLLFELENWNDLAEKMVSLLNNRPKITEMGKAARRKMETEYNVDLHYQRLMAIIRTVIS